MNAVEMKFKTEMHNENGIRLLYGIYKYMHTAQFRPILQFTSALK